jgi:hypothetical protein
MDYSPFSETFGIDDGEYEDIKLYSLVGFYRRFGGIYCPYF